jgi:acyl-CoA dehydrogenase
VISDQLDWPFFEDRHRALDRDVRAWLVAQSQHDEDDVDAACRAWVRALGEGGFLRHCVPAAYGRRLRRDRLALAVPHARALGRA